MKVLEIEYSIEKKEYKKEYRYVLNRITYTDTGCNIQGKPFRTKKECTDLISKLKKGVILWNTI